MNRERQPASSHHGKIAEKNITVIIQTRMKTLVGCQIVLHLHGVTSFIFNPRRLGHTGVGIVKRLGGRPRGDRDPVARLARLLALQMIRLGCGLGWRVVGRRNAAGEMKRSFLHAL